jgi:hypothetical protein
LVIRGFALCIGDDFLQSDSEFYEKHFLIMLSLLSNFDLPL